MVLLRNVGFVRGLSFILPALIAGLAAAETPTNSTTGLLSLREVAANGDARLAIDAAKLNSLWSVKVPVEIAMPLGDGELVSLTLSRFEVVRPGARFFTVIDGRQMGTQPPRVLLLRGSIADEPNSHVYLAMDELGGGSGSVTRGDGRQFTIGTDAADGRAVGLRIHSGAGDVPDFPNFCGAATHRVESPLAGAEDTPGGTAQLDPRGPRALIVALDGDQSFVQLFPNTAAAQSYMIQLVGAVSDIYMRELNFRLWVDFVRTWDAGGEPFGAANLNGFRSHWINNEDLTGLNLVHLLSGRRDLSYGGVAFLADACNQFGFAISGFLLGSFPSNLGSPHLGNWDVDVVAHEMGHNLGTLHTHDYEPPIDECATGVHERGTIMSYCHTNPGGLLNTDMRMHRTVEQFIADNNTPVLAPCLFHDCNGNGIDDEIDINETGWFDNNFNGIPDACEDCNNNGQLDADEILLGAPDLNGNGLLDACEPDCNGNSVPDLFEISTGAALDFNGSGIPDTCEPDCNNNGVPDFEDIRLGTHTDIDRNSVPDACQDCNVNGIVDWIDVDRQFNWFIAQNSATSPVREYHAASGVLVRTLGAGLIDAAYDLAFGPDRQLYVASYPNSRIVKINIDTGVASTFVASGVGGLASPAGLTFGPDGHLYVSNQANSSVLRYNGTTGAFIGVFVPGGSAGLLTPWGLTFGPNGNLFVVSSSNQVLQYNGTTGASLGIFIGGFGPGGGGLSDPRDLVFLPNGQALVTNRTSNVIKRYSASGSYVGQFNDNSVMSAPWGIVLGTNGNVYAARTGGEVRVIEYDVNAGRYIRAFVRGDTNLIAPTAFAIRSASPNDADGDGLPDSCGTAPCPADVFPPAPGPGGAGGDGAVNIEDVLLIIANWGAAGPGDINGDNIVGILDLLMAINNWGACG